MSNREEKRLVVIASAIILIALGLIGFFIGKPLVKFISDSELVRAWVDSHGWNSRIAFVGMLIFQVLIAFIPGEPFELAAGYAFGALEGTILCLVGISIGSVLVFLLVRCFGMRIVRIFFSEEKIAQLKFLKTNQKREMLFLFVYMLPGTPKDLLGYYAGLTDMPFLMWFLISFLGRIPSVITSTLGGSALGNKQYGSAIIVFVITFVVSILGIVIYNRSVSNYGRK